MNIRYSVDQTGNNPGGNWVLESDNVNIKNVYFTSNIDSWSGILTSAVNTSDSFFNDGTYFSSSTVDGITTVTLLQDIVWEDLRSSGAVSDYINVMPNTVFDGSGYTITINSASSNVSSYTGLISVDSTVTLSTRPTIKNITIDVNSSGSVTCSSNSGFLIKQSQYFFILDNCDNTSNCKLTPSTLLD